MGGGGLLLHTMVLIKWVPKWWCQCPTRTLQLHSINEAIFSLFRYLPQIECGYFFFEASPYPDMYIPKWHPLYIHKYTHIITHSMDPKYSQSKKKKRCGVSRNKSKTYRVSTTLKYNSEFHTSIFLLLDELPSNNYSVSHYRVKIDKISCFESVYLKHQPNNVTCST
jgi:hypothetical protein